MSNAETLQLRTDTAEVNGARIAYDIAGNGRPVVLLHAGIGDRRMWDDQIAAFAERFTVIRYDARGFGDTIKPPAPFSPHADLIGLLNHLGIAQAHLVGVSLGSHTAIDAAVAAPERVSALVAVGARTGVPPTEVLRRGWEQVDELYEAGDVAGAVELELRMWVDGPNRGPDAVDPAVREKVRDMNAALFARDDTEGEEIRLEPPAAGRLGELRVPTLVVVGDQDVPDVLAAANVLTSGIPGARKAVIPDAAHVPNMERPKVFNRLVLELLMGLQET